MTTQNHHGQPNLTVEQANFTCLFSMKTNTTFSKTEEDFLLRSLKEVVNVWAMGSGQASFNLDIINGVADLKLGVQLGLPSSPHLD